MMNAALKRLPFQDEHTSSSAEAALLKLQVDQFEHDENYHREICRLSMHHRLNHLALHFAKYAGQLAEACAEKGRTERLVVDIFIIAISCSNVLNIRLGDHLDPLKGTAANDLIELGEQLRTSTDPSPIDREALFRWTAIAAGRMAKACEKLDHIEDYPFRKVITESVVDIAKGPLIFAASHNWDLVNLVHKRLQGVKKKSVLHGLI